MGVGAQILAELAALRAEVAQVRAEVAALRAGGGAQSAPAAGGAVASAADLDGPHGDPEVKKDPKRWQGQAMAPCRMSECPPDYLDVLAGFKDWQAGKDEEQGTDEAKKSARYKRLDAARARGWAARKRAAAQGNGHAAGVTALDDEI